MTKLYKKSDGEYFEETRWTAEEVELTEKKGAEYIVEALDLRKKVSDLEYNLKCRDDELAEAKTIMKNREAFIDWMSKKHPEQVKEYLGFEQEEEK